jgi:hypothetical protein
VRKDQRSSCIQRLSGKRQPNRSVVKPRMPRGRVAATRSAQPKPRMRERLNRVPFEVRSRINEGLKGCNVPKQRGNREIAKVPTRPQGAQRPGPASALKPHACLKQKPSIFLIVMVLHVGPPRMGTEGDPGGACHVSKREVFSKLFHWPG